MFKKAVFCGSALTGFPTYIITEVTYTGLTGTVLPLIEEYKYLQVFRNGLFMTQEIDYTVDATKITFIGNISIGETDSVKLILYK